MRRASRLTCTLAVPALLLAGCSGSEPEGTSPSTPGDGVSASSPAGGAAGGDDATEGEDTAGTSADAATTDAPAEGAGEDEGGEEGQAAAAVAKDFLVAMSSADPKACDYLLSFTDVDVPMKSIDSDYETCETLLPEVLNQDVEAQGMDAESTAEVKAMTIDGADVQGDTAIIDRDNFSAPFDESMGDKIVTLKKVEGTWYIDLDNTFVPATRR